mgnify:FL=1
MALYTSLVILFVFTLVFMFLTTMDTNIRRNNGMFLTLLFVMSLFWLVYWCIKIFGSVYGIN